MISKSAILVALLMFCLVATFMVASSSASADAFDLLNDYLQMSDAMPRTSSSSRSSSSRSSSRSSPRSSSRSSSRSTSRSTRTTSRSPRSSSTRSTSRSTSRNTRSRTPTTSRNTRSNTRSTKTSRNNRSTSTTRNTRNTRNTRSNTSTTRNSRNSRTRFNSRTPNTKYTKGNRPSRPGINHSTFSSLRNRNANSRINNAFSAVRGAKPTNSKLTPEAVRNYGQQKLNQQRINNAFSATNQKQNNGKLTPEAVLASYNKKFNKDLPKNVPIPKPRPTNLQQNKATNTQTDKVTQRAPSKNSKDVVTSAMSNVRANAHSKSQGDCAKYTANAIEKSLTGKTYTVNRPHSAKDFGSWLNKMGYQKVDGPMKAGDVQIYNSIPGHPDGHMQMLTNDGKFVSDFVQTDMYPGKAYRNSHQVPTNYRYVGN